ncbi:MAG: macro domain-containing protein, partial [Acidobacteriota bacterium]|nr:macro domain-containing protein [Acidobacteriota bacterium]
SLLGGGGVDGAIHRAAGPGLLAECRTLGGCETGKAKLTKGYNLTAPYVIHAVGPVWRGGTGGEEALLAGAYRSALDLAAENGIRSVAFPNISTGVYGYPKDKAAAVAIRTVSNFLDGHPEMDKVIFVCFDEDNHRLYERRLGG